MSYYLKYRPQQIEELDLETVRNTLGRILSSGKFAHAYLFTGPKGTGKTSSARILAKVLNCEKNKKVIQNLITKKKDGESLNEPCGKCDQCSKIRKGTSLAVLEMDAASNRGIDDIRQLRERIGLVTAEGQMTVYVIDEVHMLTTEAFNALLKTLEEPPEHVVFVLCTTEDHKVPDTVKSRCTRVQFSKAKPIEVKRSLLKTINGEKLDIDDDALELITKRVDGSFRDGMKILEQLAQSGEKITTESVDELTGFSDSYNSDDLIKSLKNYDVQEGMKILEKKANEGIDLGVFGKRLVEDIRELIVSEVMSKHANLDNIRNLNDMVRLFSKAVMEIKYAVLPQLPLEIALVEWCTKDEKPEPQILNPKTTSIQKVRIAKVVEPKKKIQARKDVLKTKNVLVGDLDVEEVKKNWPNLLRAVKPHNHSLEALLRSAEPETCVADNMTIRVYYNFHKEQLEQDRHRLILEKVFAEELGNPVRLSFILGEKANQAIKVEKSIENVSGVVDGDLAQAAEDIFS